MANIAAARIQREFKEVVKSEEVTCVSIGEQKYSFISVIFSSNFPEKKKNGFYYPGSWILYSLFITYNYLAYSVQ